MTTNHLKPPAELALEGLAEDYATLHAKNEQLQNLADRTLTLLTLLESGPWKNSPDDADWRKLLADLRGG